MITDDLTKIERAEFVHPIDPSLPPLPLVDGCLFLDNSFMELLVTCQRQAQYRKIHGRRLAEERSSLWFGGAMHQALEHRYRNAGIVSPAAIQNGQIELLTKLWERSPIPPDDFRTLTLATELIERYNQRYRVEPFFLMTGEMRQADGTIITQPLVEMSFAIELASFPVPTWVHKSGKVTIIYTGRIDLVIEWDGQVFTMDHKTTSMLGGNFFDEQYMSPQHEGYVWAGAKVFGKKPAGFAINAIRTRKPARTVDQVKDDDFARQKYYLDDDRVNEWEFNIKYLIHEFLTHYIHGYFPMEKKWCVAKYGKCQYFDVCSSPRDSRLMMLNSNQYTNDTWSPLHGRNA